MRNFPVCIPAAAAAALALAATTCALTSIPDTNMTFLLARDGVDLAMRAQPMFLMGQAVGKPPCIPTFATGPDGRQAAPSVLCAWPDSGCECRNPGVPLGSELPALPVYFSLKRCGDAEVRVAYNLFYTKDGFIPNKIFGHAFDWERVVVVWNRGNGSWTPGELFLSQHMGYQKIKWGEIKNTLGTQDGGKPRGGEDGRRNLDHPKCYIASAKHDMHQEKSTAWVDVLSQLTNHAYRSDGWWYFPRREDYIRADGETDIGKLIASYSWGSADSTPPSVAEGLCDA